MRGSSSFAETYEGTTHFTQLLKSKGVAPGANFPSAGRQKIQQRGMANKVVLFSQYAGEFILHHEVSLSVCSLGSDHGGDDKGVI